MSKLNDLYIETLESKVKKSDEIIYALTGISELLLAVQQSPDFKTLFSRLFTTLLTTFPLPAVAFLIRDDQGGRSGYLGFNEAILSESKKQDLIEILTQQCEGKIDWQVEEGVSFLKMPHHNFVLGEETLYTTFYPATLPEEFRNSNDDLRSFFLSKTVPRLKDDQVCFFSFEETLSREMEELWSTFAPFLGQSLINIRQRKNLISVTQSLDQEVHKKEDARLHLQNILQSSPDPIFVLGTKNRIRLANPAACQLLEYEQKDLVGKPISSLLAEEAMGSKILTEVKQQGSMVDHEVSFFSRTGRKVPMLLSCSTMKDGDKKFSGIVMIAKDITERKRMEDLRSEFINTVSHELRTPLTIIKGSVGNLKDGILGELNANQARTVEITSKNIDRLGRLINDMLDLSRLESGRAELHRRRISIETLAEEIRESFSAMAAKKNLNLIVQIEKNCPDLYADSDMLFQVLTNLINNATRYAKSEIVVSFSSLVNFVQISVEDNGSGIEPENLNRMFSKFEQLHRPQGGGGYKGTGLGLSICKEIVKNNKGKIWAESPVGGGGSFHATLPAYNEAFALTETLSETLKTAKKFVQAFSVLVFWPSDGKRHPEFLKIVERVSKKSFLRKEDHLLLHPGGALIALVKECPKKMAKEIAGRMKLALKNESSSLGSQKGWVDWRVGTASYPDEELGGEALLELALKRAQAKAKIRLAKAGGAS